MAIYIKGMEMPKDCQYCPCCKWKHNGDGILGCLAKNYYFTEMELCHEGKPSWCPLTEIPEPHGRLIDGDKVIEYVDEWLEWATKIGITVTGEEAYYKLKDAIDDAPTVIEGSEYCGNISNKT